MEDIKEDIEKIIKILKNNVNPSVIILFGSFSRNTQNVESDIDIAYKSEKSDRNVNFEISKKLEKTVKKDVDIVNLDDIGDGFRYEILMNGIVLYCEDSIKFDMYKLDMFREYLELNESRQDIINNIKKGGTIYGK